MGNGENGNIEVSRVKHNIPDFKGMEKLESVPELKSGSFREFLNKVMGIRQDPEKEKQAHDEIKKIDSDSELSDEEKKSQLRGIDRVKLFAIIGKHINFTEDHLEITLNFGDLTFAEQQAIGAGDILPPAIRNITFTGTDHETEPTAGSRSIGPNGREYQSEKQHYMSSYTGTKLSIAYKDIMATNNEQAQEMEKVEEKRSEQAAEVVQAAKADKQDLKQDVAQQSIVQPRLPETRETGVSHQPLFIGDSQMEGIGNYYLKGQGIDYIDLRSMRMEVIADTLDNPSKIDAFYRKKLPKNDVEKKKLDAFIKHRKERLMQGRERIKTADAIVLQCGGNNIAWNDSLKDMQSSLEKLIKTIGAIRGNDNPAPIHVGMLMIREETPPNSVSRQYNQWLVEEAAKGKFRIINSEKIIKESGIPRGKGVHLGPSGYINLAKQALKAINYQKT